MKRQGYILLLVMIILLILSSLSISLFKINALDNKANQHDIERLNSFYRLENCLGQARLVLAQQKKPLIVLPHCRNQQCVNGVDVNLIISEQALSWWQQNGFRCDAEHWEYWEYLYSNPEMNAYYYRVSIIDRDLHLLRSTFKLDTHLHTLTSLAWQMG